MLSASTVQNSPTRDKPYKLTDGHGLYLLVRPDGARWWRFDYRRPTGKRNTLSLGTFPTVTLKRAREKRDEARTMLADGVDPGAERIAKKVAQGDSFEAVAREWNTKRGGVLTEDYAKDIIYRMENALFPWIGAVPVGELTPPELLACLRRVEERGAVETARRLRGYAGQVMRYAIATGRATRDIAADLRGAMTPTKASHHAAITDPIKVGELLRALDGYQGSLVTRSALKLAPLVFVRPGELRSALWADFDLDAATWIIPAERMKMRHAHMVPLSKQAVAVLRELQPLTGRGRFVFPSVRSAMRPMSENTVNVALRAMGFDGNTMTGHGFRAMARTILDEVLGFRPDWIEHQLAHAVRDPNGRAYNRTAHLAEREKMMQAWADYLDTLRAGGNVVPIARKRA